MESFVDLLLISIASGAAVLLLLILVSFLLCQRRIGYLEAKIDELKDANNIQNNTIDSLTKELSSLNQKLSNTQKTVSYLAKNQEDIIDRQEEFKSNLVKLDVKQEEQQQQIIQNVPENQPILEATSLIKQGLSKEEVAARTNLSQTELEMLYAVTKKPFVKESTTMSQVTKEPSSSEDISHDAVHLEMHDDLSISQRTNDHRVANFKARNAYGMGAKSLISRNR